MNTYLKTFKNTLLICLLSLNFAHAEEIKSDGKSFVMDIPSEWLKVAENFKNKPQTTDTNDIKLLWGHSSKAAPEFKHLDSNQKKPSLLQAKNGTIELSYTSANLINSASSARSLKLNGGVEYAKYEDLLLDIHYFAIKAGASTNLLEWNKFKTQVFLLLMRNEWIAPEGKFNLSQNRSSYSLESGLEITRPLWNSDYYASLASSLQSSFSDTNSRNSFFTRIGIGVSL